MNRSLNQSYYANINLDNCDLYEYVMENDQLNQNNELYFDKEKTKLQIETFNVPKFDSIKKDNSFNIILIVAIVLILLGLYCYFTESNQIAQDSLVDQYYS